MLRKLFRRKNIVKLVDRDGHTVHMTKEEIAESLRDMGNTAGGYLLVPWHWGVLQSTHGKGEPVVQFRASTMPHYRFYQLWDKKFRWWLKQRKLRKAFDRANNMGLIWQPTPFVLERPWLRLKGKRAVTIEVE